MAGCGEGGDLVTYFVSLTGNDVSGDGSEGNPWATVPRAYSVAAPGTTIMVRGGVYHTDPNNKWHFDKAGEPGNPIKIVAYPGEIVQVDGSRMRSSYNGASAIRLRGASYHLIEGIDVVAASFFGVCFDYGASYNTARRVRVTGATASKGKGPVGIFMADVEGYFSSHNLIENCDAWDNSTPRPKGDTNAGDGFQIMPNGPGNVVRGCRAWRNPDDGFDTYYAREAVRFEDCWAWENGWNGAGVRGAKSDGNGFKVGPGAGFIDDEHLLIRCVSWNNALHGFDQNNNEAEVRLWHCAAAYNGGDNTALPGAVNWGRNFYFAYQPAGELTNCLSVYANAGLVDAFLSGVVQTSNSWQVAGFDPVEDVVLSGREYAVAPRAADGSLPPLSFLAPLPSGRLVDAGTPVGGLPYLGSAPDVSWKEVE